MKYSIEEQEFDFIERTQKILKQYQKLIIDKINKYEVTLFVNCLIGLLIVPQQKWFNDLPTDLITKDEWGIAPDVFNFGENKTEKKNLKNFVRHLRNSLSHYNFYFHYIDKEISSITFKDLDPKTKQKTFEAKINVEDLQKFVDIFISTMLDLKKP